MEIIKGIKPMEILDGIIVGVTIVATEKLTAPFIGTGTLKSGAIKMIGGTVLKSAFRENKVLDHYLGTALQIDGTLDISYWLWNKFFGSVGSNNQSSGMII